MLESDSASGCARRAASHYGSPDKQPAVRLETIAAAGELQGAVHHRHPDRHRRDARRAHRGAAGDPRPARALRPHPGSHRPELPRQARHQAWPTPPSPISTTCCGPSPWRGWSSGRTMNIQAPPNLSPGVYPRLIGAGHQRLGRRLAGDARPRQSRGAVAGDRASWRARTAAAGKLLVERLPIYPAYARDARRLARARGRHAGARA